MIGGIAATLHGSPLRTGDADICPARTPANLSQLADALAGMEAAIRGDREPVPLPADGGLLATSDIRNLTTRFGDLDIAFRPAGTDGYDDLVTNAVRYELRDGIEVRVASLDDVIRSKRAADRAKDRGVLPVLEALREDRGD